MTELLSYLFSLGDLPQSDIDSVNNLHTRLPVFFDRLWTFRHRFLRNSDAETFRGEVVAFINETRPLPYVAASWTAEIDLKLTFLSRRVMVELRTIMPHIAFYCWSFGTTHYPQTDATTALGYYVVDNRDRSHALRKFFDDAIKDEEDGQRTLRQVHLRLRDYETCNANLSVFMNFLFTLLNHCYRVQHLLLTADGNEKLLDSIIVACERQFCLGEPSNLALVTRWGFALVG